MAFIQHKIRLFALAAGVALLLISALNPSVVSALILSQRSVAVSTAVPSATAVYTYSFTFTSTSNVGSVQFLYCSNSALFEDPCVAPTGLDVSGATLSQQSGNVGFSIDAGNTTATSLLLTRPVAGATPIASTYQFSGITNPSTANQTVFVRIRTFASTDGSGSSTDQGAVAYATQNFFSVGAYVPPFIKLCVAVTLAIDCSSANGDSINLGTLSNTTVRTATSQFSIATNDPGGYVAYVSGTTMTSGNNTITALTSPTPSLPGQPQFGLNLRQNTVPSVGSEPDGSGSATPIGSYANQNQFAFNTGDAVASATSSTDHTRMTVSYIVNIPRDQKPGQYTTTLTYIAVAQF